MMGGTVLNLFSANPWDLPLSRHSVSYEVVISAAQGLPDNETACYGTQQFALGVYG